MSTRATHTHCEHGVSLVDHDAPDCAKCLGWEVPPLPDRIKIERLEAEVARLRVIVSAAEDLVSYPCHCDYCWTSRGRHAPQGCTFEDAADLRQALQEYGPRSTSAPTPPTKLGEEP